MYTQSIAPLQHHLPLLVACCASGLLLGGKTRALIESELAGVGLRCKSSRGALKDAEEKILEPHSNDTCNPISLFGW